MRLQRDTTKQEFGMSLRELLDKSLITWHGIKLNQPDWTDHSHSIAMTVQSLNGKIAMHYMINAYTEPLDFEIPVTHKGEACKWRQWIDTGLESPADIYQFGKGAVINGLVYSLKAHTVAIFRTELLGLNDKDF
jgi:glycogen operon protein